MREDLTQTLYSTFPVLYSRRHLPISESLMSYGFCCGDGWYSILYRLSVRLTRIISEMPPEIQRSFTAVQVKEKFGTLRFYMGGPNMRGYEEGMAEAIGEAQEESARTCERCGQPGETGGGGYILTLCPVCREENERRLREMRLRDEIYLTRTDSAVDMRAVVNIDE